MNTLFVKKISNDATIPTRATSESIGYDLYSAKSKTIKSKSIEIFSTGIQIILPPSCYGRIAPRSGLSIVGIDVLAGVIDRDYTGDIQVVLINHSLQDLHINVGDRIAQLICEVALTPNVIEFSGDLDETQRGEFGFGSTGV